MASLSKTISSHQNNYNSIRFFLAASVIYFHSFALTKATGYIDYLSVRLHGAGLSVGGLAVDCFFFLSGLFVAQSFYRDKSPINFVIRRFCRIWPGLFVCVAVTAILACILSKGFSAWYFLTMPDFYYYVMRNSVLSLVWEIPGVFPNRPYSAINGSIHTLPTEVKMYFLLLCAGLIQLLWRKLAFFFSGLFILLASFIFYEFFQRHLNMPNDGQAPMAMFFAGVMAFSLADHIKIHLWPVAACLGMAMIAPPPWNTTFALATSALVMIVVGQMRHGWRPKADVSYGVYIYGWPCQQFILTFFPSLNPYLLFVSALLLAYGFAFLSWRIIEKPAIAFGHGLAATWTQWRSAGRFPPALAPLRRLAELPRFAAICLAFLTFGGMRLMADHIHIGTVSSLGVQIIAFGPTQAKAGGSFNVQPTGASAIWVAFDKPPPNGTYIVFDGERLETQIGPTAATATVPDALFAQSGDKTVLLELLQPGQRQQSAPVTVHVSK